ncbi:hypothetical protein EDD16DRAFT_1515249 [Pisolithus croceorrhizus]|nr:hypothetical protein EV401DRAFT_1886687 [Pisolithus croceorrhizus]KAI6131089.1 hypothetical protein EDD16DRAFT_1515249 [Pisolithus croceorrhizus]KAI6160486.1 hypothetical protein EDD17DRAFT_1510308 [Pisolithus thermaeus]
MKTSECVVPQALGVSVAHDHGHSHILTLQIASAFFKLIAHEDDVKGLKQRLAERLAPSPESERFNAPHGMENEWEIGDGLAHWWTPNFETFMASLHIPRILTLLIITVPVYPCTHHKAEGMQRVVLGTYAWTKFSAVLAVPKNMKLLTIPLFELITRLVIRDPELLYTSKAARGKGGKQSLSSTLNASVSLICQYPDSHEFR